MSPFINAAFYYKMDTALPTSKKIQEADDFLKNTLHQNMTTWHIEHFKLKVIETTNAGKSL